MEPVECYDGNAKQHSTFNFFRKFRCRDILFFSLVFCCICSQIGMSLGCCLSRSNICQRKRSLLVIPFDRAHITHLAASQVWISLHFTKVPLPCVPHRTGISCRRYILYLSINCSFKPSARWGKNFMEFETSNHQFCDTLLFPFLFYMSFYFPYFIWKFGSASVMSFLSVVEVVDSVRKKITK